MIDRACSTCRSLVIEEDKLEYFVFMNYLTFLEIRTHAEITYDRDFKGLVSI